MFKQSLSSVKSSSGRNNVSSIKSVSSAISVNSVNSANSLNSVQTVSITVLTPCLMVFFVKWPFLSMCFFLYFSLASHHKSTWLGRPAKEEEEERAAFSFDEFGRGQLFQLEICQECTISKIFAQYPKYLDSSWRNLALKRFEIFV